MKVMIYADAWGAGGIEAYFLNVFRHLKDTEIKFSVVCHEKLKEMLFEEPLRELGVPFAWQSDNDRRIMPSKQAEFLMSEIERQKPDILHMNLSTGKSFYFSHKIKQRFPTLKIIHHAHCGRIGGKYVPIKRIVFGFWRWLYEKESDYRIGCSKQILDWAYTSISDRGGHEPRVLLCSIDTERNRFNPSARKTYRDRFGLNDDTILVGTIGRMCEHKNSLFIVDIVRSLADRNLNFKFLWIGLGEDEQAVKEKAHNLGLDDRIIFFGISHDVPGLLSAMDMFILPSNCEGLGIVLIEAQASGLYSLASEPVPPEAKVVDGKYFVLPLGDAGVWAEKIAEIAGGDLTDRRYPEKELEECGFNPETNARELEKIYRMLYAEKGSRR